MIGGILIGLLVLLATLLMLLLVLPLSLVIDTEKSLFYLRWFPIVMIQLLADESGWRWSFKLFNRSFQFSKGAAQQPKPKPRAAKKKSGASFFTLSRIRALFKNMRWAIQIRQLVINWDTGDFIKNAQLYPLFRIACKESIRLNINFMGQQELIIRLQTRLYRLVYAGLRVYFL